MAIVRTAIRNLLIPTANSVFWDHKTYNSQYKEIYTTTRSHMASETDIELRPFGLAQFKEEASPFSFDNGFGQRNKTIYMHKTVALGFGISQEALSDNLYANKYGSMVGMLKQSMMITKDILAATPLNGAFTTYMTGDGTTLCSTQHPTDGGYYSNRPAIASALSEASIESMITMIRRLKDLAGKPIHLNAVKLLVPPELEWAAARLTLSTHRVGTNNNDISVINKLASLPKGYVVNNYLTDANAYFIITDAVDGFKHFVKEDLKVEVDTDFKTANVLTRVSERYCFGVTNPRVVIGNPGV
jgi:phage major head subunit gpT-like protein